MLKFNINSADWMPLAVRNSFIELHGEFISPRGTVLVVREDTRSATDNQKLAMKQLESMVDKAEKHSLVERSQQEFPTEQERIKASKTEMQIERYKNRILESKRMDSKVKRNRKIKDWHAR
jgi:hypothetical protein